jgi:hypothetical protein
MKSEVMVLILNKRHPTCHTGQTKKLSLVTLAFTSVLLAQQPVSSPRSQAAKGVSLGEQVGSCLILKCQAFRGTLLTESPKAGEPVAVRVQEWLFGTPTPGDTVLVPYDNRPAKSGFGTATAWANAELGANVPVTVVIALETGGGVFEGEPVLVTFNDREAALVRRLTEEALLLKRKPDLISAEVASLSSATSPAIAGYLLEYVMFSKEITQRGLSARLLMQMLGNPGVPPEEWDTIPFFLIAASGGLPPEERSGVTMRFVDLAQQADEHAARAGFIGLRMLASPLAASPSDGLLLSSVPPAVLSKLGAAYRALLQKNAIEPSVPLEVLLGMREPR